MDTKPNPGFLKRLFPRKDPPFKKETTATEKSPSLSTGDSSSEKKALWHRITSRLRQSSSQLTENISHIFTTSHLSEEQLESLEEVLIRADFGIETSAHLITTLKQKKFQKDISSENIRIFLAQEIENILRPLAAPLSFRKECSPHVILMVGVNGTGKTTTAGKLASKFLNENLSVILCAGDTFRAAAVEQLQIWGERIHVPVLTGPPGADPASLAFDALRIAQDKKADILIIDTAGRLHNRDELMAELGKIIRVLKKQDPLAPHDVLLTIDATTGQNALKQIEVFKQYTGVTGLIMTKLDGTSKGGIIVSVGMKYKLPMHYIGTGESLKDLEVFSPHEFSNAMLGL